MKLVKVVEKNDVSLIPMGDFHVGSRNFDKKKLEDMVKWVKNKKNARILLMGDEIDCMLSGGPGSPFDDKITPEQQIDYVLDLLKPVKGKIWCMLSGNHEDYVKKHTSIDVSKLMAKNLGVPYGESSCFIKAKVGKANYIIYASHGSSGSLTPSGKLNAVMKLSQIADADLYCMGHLHELADYTTEHYKVNIGDKMVNKYKKHYVLTGHFLNYGGYAQKKNMLPGKTGVAKILLKKDKKDIHVSL